MIQNPLQGENPYSDEYAKFRDSKQFNKLKSKFEVKPYYKENKPLKLLCMALSYLFNILSIVISFSFVYSIFNTPKGLIISIVVLGIIEGFKRLLLPNLFKNYLQFSLINYLPSLCIILLISLSGFLSYKGGNVAIQQLTPPVETINVDSIRKHYSLLIEKKELRQNELSKVTYKGSTTRTAQKAILSIQEEIKGLREQEKERVTEAKKFNSEAVAAAESQTSVNGLYFSLLALIFDILLIVCIAYCEYYDYRSYAEYSTHKKRPANDQKTVDTATVLTPKKDKNVRKCANCSNVIEGNNPRKKYCSDKCRVENWNKKNGKKLTVPTD